MRNNYVLIDFENVVADNLELLDQEWIKVLLFVGKNQTKLPLALVKVVQKLGARAQYIEMMGTGHNALDFHIAFYIGRISATDKDAIGTKRDRGVFTCDKDFIAAFKTRNVYKMNPRVRAYTLERLENFGTREMVDVYKRIKEECDRNGNPYPDWTDRPGEFLTIYRARGSQGAEVGGKEWEVGSNVREVGPNGIEDGSNVRKVGSKIDFVAVIPNVRKDFRETCCRVWELLCQDDTLLQQDVSERLEIALNSIQNAYAALKDAGLLIKTGEGRGSKWTVVRGKFPQA